MKMYMFEHHLHTKPKRFLAAISRDVFLGWAHPERILASSRWVHIGNSPTLLKLLK